MVCSRCAEFNANNLFKSDSARVVYYALILVVKVVAEASVLRAAHLNKAFAL